MEYYAIRNKETKLYLTINYLTGQYEYTSKEINPYLLKDKGCANICIEGDHSVEAVPVELKEVVDDPQEQAREYCAKALLDNRVYLPIRESKPKWYEINPNTIVRLDGVEKLEMYASPNNPNKNRWQIWLIGNNSSSKIDDLTEEEATAKYNELKKLLEEV